MKKLRCLHQRIEITKGMKAMVTTNLATEADLANASWGKIINIKLDPRESVDKEQATATGIVKLQYPPATIIFKPIHAMFPQFEGLKKAKYHCFHPSMVSTVVQLWTPRYWCIEGSMCLCLHMHYNKQSTRTDDRVRYCRHWQNTQTFLVGPFCHVHCPVKKCQ